MRIPFLICLLSVTALIWGLAAEAGEESDDYVVLTGGERLGGEIVATGPRTVTLRIGTRRYALERTSLKTVSREGRHVYDPAHVTFVTRSAHWLSHSDIRLRRAAAAGLRALGDDGEAVMAYVVETTDDAPVREALSIHMAARRGADDQPGGAAWTQRFIDGQVGWAKENIGLTAEQEPGFRSALGTFLKSLRSAGDRDKARAAFYSALEKTLAPEQVKGLRTAWEKMRRR